MSAATVKKQNRFSAWMSDFKAKSGIDKRRAVSDLLFNNAMYIIIAAAIIYIAVRVPAFLSVSSIVNIVSLTAAKLPIALGIGGVAVPKYVLYAVILTVIMWVIWNKTKFGKNMFAVGSNEEAANVSGVNVFWTIVMVFVLAGVMYGITGFIEGARIASCSANTGLNYESDAIAACVIGGVSFVGGTGKISGIVIGVFLLQIIFVGLNFLSVDANMLYVIKGLIILVACAIDMRKYLARK